MHKLCKHLIGACGVLGVALFFLIFSCTQKLPTTPQSDLITSTPPGAVATARPPGLHTDLVDADVGGEEQSEPDTVIAFDPTKMDTTSTEVGIAVFRTVDFDGDTIPFPIGTKDTAHLIFPRGAIKIGENVLLNLKGTAMRTTDSTMLVALYDFLPHGTVFEKECYLIQPARFKEGAQLELSWYDQLSGKWVQENTATVVNGRVVFVIKHFSNYGAPLEALSSGGQ